MLFFFYSVELYYIMLLLIKLLLVLWMCVQYLY